MVNTLKNSLSKKTKANALKMSSFFYLRTLYFEFQKLAIEN